MHTGGVNREDGKSMRAGKEGEGEGQYKVGNCTSFGSHVSILLKSGYPAYKMHIFIVHELQDNLDQCTRRMAQEAHNF